jgi:hypothetical protein
MRLGFFCCIILSVVLQILELIQIGGLQSQITIQILG